MSEGQKGEVFVIRGWATGKVCMEHPLSRSTWFRAPQHYKRLAHIYTSIQFGSVFRCKVMVVPFKHPQFLPWSALRLDIYLFHSQFNVSHENKQKRNTSSHPESEWYYKHQAFAFQMNYTELSVQNVPHLDPQCLTSGGVIYRSQSNSGLKGTMLRIAASSAGSYYSIFTALLLKRCELASSLDDVFTEFLLLPRVSGSTFCWRSLLVWDLINWQQFQSLHQVLPVFLVHRELTSIAESSIAWLLTPPYPAQPISVPVKFHDLTEMSTRSGSCSAISLDQVIL